MSIKTKRNYLIIILAIISIVIVGIAILSIASLKSANYYFEKGNYSKAKELYSISYMSSFGLNSKAKIRMSKSEEENTRQLSNNTQSTQQTLITIPLDKISITGKRVMNQYHSTGQDITLSAIVKNNSGIGIPSVKIKKVTMLDGNNKEVAVKTDFGNETIPLVNQGEYPFSLLIFLEKQKPIEVKDFNLELEIPSFKPNNRVVRLSLTKPIRVSTETMDMYPMYPGKANTFNFEYKTTVTNDSDGVVDNIYRISFLKYKDFALTRIGAACCSPVNFEKENDSQILNLDKPIITYSLNPKESREYRFKISTDPALIDSLIDPSTIELITYFIGSSK